MFDFVLKWLVNALAVLITSYLIPGVELTAPAWSLVIAAVLTLLNTLLRPVLIILTLPVTLLTFGLFLLVINALLVLIAAGIIPDFVVNSFWSALGFCVVLAIIQSIFEALIRREGS